jgi:tRNA A-37 threonylcarbamoyl transferase component Bud32
MPTSTPAKLGRYEVVEEIGKGAMGVVYLARDPLIGRQVALKTFRVGLSERDHELAQFRHRFVREAQSAGILSHPNIVTIHDVVDDGDDGMCFIAMEYVKGTNLKSLMQRPEPFSLEFLVNVVSQIADGLDYAHMRGVVHRDIKPANILIDADNRVKITDFGIARLDTSNLTMEGQLLGTPNYMAPEQIQGKEIDHRADIFSLGVVLYEMVTRRKPFQGENLTVVTHKIVYEPFTPAEEIVKDLPSGLSSILSKSLEKDPSRRYQRAAEISEDLRKLLAKVQQMDDTSATQEVPVQMVPAKLPSVPPPPAVVRPTAPAAPPKTSCAAPAPVPAGPQPAPAAPQPAPAPAPSPAPAAPATRRMWPWVAVGGLLLVAIVAGGAWILTSQPREPAAAVPVPDANAARFESELSRVRGLVLQGRFVEAQNAIAGLESLRPGAADVAAIRSEVERRVAEQTAAAERQRQIADGLAAARESLTDRRFVDAAAAAHSVLALDPVNEEAQKLLADAESGSAKPRDRAKTATSPPAHVVPSPISTAPAAQVAPEPAAEPVTVSNEATLDIAFHSELSEGIITIYAGERQIVREPFKFVRKTGFLRSEKMPGDLSFRRTVAAGASTLRVYLSLPNRPTKAISVDGRLTGGGAHRLSIQLDQDGTASASFE